MPQTQPPTTQLSRAGSARKPLFGAACLSGQSLLLNALSIPAMALIIRKLGPVRYGEWVTAASLVSLGGFLTGMGLRGVFVRAIAKDRSRAPRLLAGQLGTRLALAMLATLAAITAALVMKYSITVVQCVAIGCIAMMASTVWTTLADLMQGLERLPTTAAISFIAGLALTLASVVAVWLGGGAVALALAYLVGPVITAACFIWILRRERLPIQLAFQFRAAATLIWSSRRFALLQMLETLENLAAATVLPALIGPALFGVFAAGAMVADRLNVIPDAIGTALYPMIARETSGHHRRNTSRTVALLGAGVCVLIAAVLTFASGFIARILMPASPHLCGRIIALSVWSLPLMALNSAAGYALLAAGHEKRQMRVVVCSFAINAPAAAILIGCGGPIGAAFFVIVRHLVRLLVTLVVQAMAQGGTAPSLVKRLAQQLIRPGRGQELPNNLAALSIEP